MQELYFLNIKVKLNQCANFYKYKSCWGKFKYWCAGLNEVLCCLATLWPEIPNNIQIIWGILPSKSVKNLIEIPKSFNPNINLYHFQPKYEHCWRIKYFFSYSKRNKMPRNLWTKFLVSGRSEPAGIYCRYKKFFAKRNNSRRSHATLGLMWAVHHMVSWITKPEFGIFMNVFIFIGLLLRKKQTR